MLSLKEAVSRLENIERLRTKVVGAFRSTLKSMEQYPVEIDPEITRQHRQNLATIEARLGGNLDGEATALEQFNSALRAELRDYRDKSAEYLRRVRKEMTSSAEALAGIIAAITEVDSGSHVRLETVLKQLRAVSARIRDPELRPAINAAADAVEHCFDDVHRQHQMHVAQLTAQVQGLQKQVVTLEERAAPVISEGILRRPELESKLEGCVTDGSAFSIAILRIRNLASAARGSVGLKDVENYLLLMEKTGFVTIRKK